MKKINLSPKAKKYMMFAGFAVVCFGALSLVLYRTNALADQPEAVSSESSAEIVLGTPHAISVPPISSEATGTGSAFVPSSGASASEPLTTVSKPTSAPPKPTPPASSALTDKSKKPTYSSKPTASKSSTSKSGGKAGEVYVPGFGWQKPTGGQGTTVGNSGDQLTGNKVGTMD